jgi:transposase
MFGKSEGSLQGGEGDFQKQLAPEAEIPQEEEKEEAPLCGAERMAMLTRKPDGGPRLSYTFSITAAMTLERVVSMQIIEGTYDRVMFENFLYRTVNKLRVDPLTKTREIAILVDNAQIHKHPWITTIAEKMKVTIIYSAQYSPWLQPAESLFDVLKRHVRGQQVPLAK